MIATRSPVRSYRPARPTEVRPARGGDVPR